MRTFKGRGARARLLRIALAVVLCIASSSVIAAAAMQARAQRLQASRIASTFVAPPRVTPGPVQLPIVAVIGDGSTSEGASGLTSEQRWPSILARADRVDVRTDAAPGAGYVTKGSDGRTFVDRAQRVPSDSQVVFIFGGSADSLATSTAVSRAVSHAIADVQIQAPGATVIIVGPLLSASQGASSLHDLSDAIDSAASAYQIRYVDPVQQAWLSSSVQSGNQLDTTDQQDIAQHFETLVTQVLRTASG